MLKKHYRIETDVARVYKARERGRNGWGWAVATIREWPKGGQVDIQSDFGTFAYAWGAIGERTLREFLCGLDFDYFMNKARGSYRVFDEEATVRRIKADIFSSLACGAITRDEAHEWRDEVDDIGDAGDAHVFAERLMGLGWCFKIYDSYPDLQYRDCPQCRAFWDGPWQALTTHWLHEVARERQPVAA